MLRRVLLILNALRQIGKLRLLIFGELGLVAEFVAENSGQFVIAEHAKIRGFDDLVAGVTESFCGTFLVLLGERSCMRLQHG